MFQEQDHNIFAMQQFGKYNYFFQNNNFKLNHFTLFIIKQPPKTGLDSLDKLFIEYCHAHYLFIIYILFLYKHDSL